MSNFNSKINVCNKTVDTYNTYHTPKSSQHQTVHTFPYVLCIQHISLNTKYKNSLGMSCSRKTENDLMLTHLT